MEYYFKFGEINEEDGSFYETDVEFPSLMKKHIQKHGTALQPMEFLRSLKLLSICYQI